MSLLLNDARQELLKRHEELEAIRLTLTLKLTLKRHKELEAIRRRFKILSRFA